MNVEFHYYITYLVAVRAGFSTADAGVLAYSAQYVDDNDTQYKIRAPKRFQRRFVGRYFRNRISQTMNILKPHKDKLKIYPLFHFIPGDAHARSAKRSDGLKSAFNTTPNSPNANRILDVALGTKNIYAMGIAIHAYVDTWAHQNFVGYKDDFNIIPAWYRVDSMAIGHAHALKNPDRVGMVWRDFRLAMPEVDNNLRFQSAAVGLYLKLRRIRGSNEDAEGAIESLKADLKQAMISGGESGGGKNRIKEYQKLAKTDVYGGAEIPLYNDKSWFDKAVKTRVIYGHRRPPYKTKRVRYWFRAGYAQTDWFKFQEAVNYYAHIAHGIISESVELPVEKKQERLAAMASRIDSCVS